MITQTDMSTTRGEGGFHKDTHIDEEVYKSMIVEGGIISVLQRQPLDWLSNLKWLVLNISYTYEQHEVDTVGLYLYLC